MNKQKIVRKYFTDHPEVLEELKREIFSNNVQLEDDDIPSFDSFLSRSSAVSCHYHKQKASARKSASSTRWYKSPKFIIPVATIVLVCLFFGLTTPGIVFAENIYETMVQWFDGDVEIQHGARDSYTFTESPEVEYYDSFESVESKLNTQMAMNPHAVLKDKIELNPVDPSLIVIKSVYLYDSLEITITQTLYGNEYASAASFDYGDGEPIDETLDNNLRFIGYFNDEHGYVVSYVDVMNAEIEISAQNIDYDTFIEFVRGVSLY